MLNNDSSLIKDGLFAQEIKDVCIDILFGEWYPIKKRNEIFL